MYWNKSYDYAEHALGGLSTNIRLKNDTIQLGNPSMYKSIFKLSYSETSFYKYTVQERQQFG